MAKEKDTKKAVVAPDDEMAEPMTKDYNKKESQEPTHGAQGPQMPQLFIQIQEAFREELTKTVGELGYNREIGSPEMHVQVFQIFEVLDKTKGKYLTEDQANQIISMIARAPYNVVSGFMKEINENQSKFFKVVTREQIEAEAAAQKAEHKATPDEQKPE